MKMKTQLNKERQVETEWFKCTTTQGEKVSRRGSHERGSAGVSPSARWVPLGRKGTGRGPAGGCAMFDTPSLLASSAPSPPPCPAFSFPLQAHGARLRTEAVTGAKHLNLTPLTALATSEDGM